MAASWARSMQRRRPVIETSDGHHSMVTRDGEDLGQRHAELPRERLPRVGLEVGCGLIGSRVG